MLSNASMITALGSIRPDLSWDAAFGFPDPTCPVDRIREHSPGSPFAMSMPITVRETEAPVNESPGNERVRPGHATSPMGRFLA